MHLSCMLCFGGGRVLGLTMTFLCQTRACSVAWVGVELIFVVPVYWFVKCPTKRRIGCAAIVTALAWGALHAHGRFKWWLGLGNISVRYLAGGSMLLVPCRRCV